MWVQWIFSVGCLVVGGYYIAALITRTGEFLGGSGSIEYELSHLTMALGMAAMFSPVGDPVPRPVWFIVFGAAAAWFAARALRTHLGADETAHHLVAALAMLFMLALPHRHAATGPVGAQLGAGHEGHTGAASGGGWIEGPVGAALALALAGYFALHTLRAISGRLPVAAAALPTGPVGPDPLPTGPVAAGSVGVLTASSRTGQPRLATLCHGLLGHGVMGAAMAVMLALMVWS